MGGVAVNPVGLGDLVAPRPALAAGVQFIPHGFGNVQLGIEMAQQLKLADGGEVRQGRRVAHYDHASLILRSVATSSSRSASS